MAGFDFTDESPAMNVSRTVPPPPKSGRSNRTVSTRRAPSGLARALAGMTGYLVAGIFLGLVLIFALSIGRGDAAAASAPTNLVTDNVVHLHAAEIGETCWQGIAKNGPARLTVALEVGVDGKIRYAAATGETVAMRGCVEAYVKAWEFLPQAQAQTMALPVEVDRR